MEKKPDFKDILLLGDSYVKNDKRKFVGVPSFDYAHGYSDGLKASEFQNERLLSALKEFVHVRYIDQELIDRAKQLINEIEKQLINDSGER